MKLYAEPPEEVRGIKDIIMEFDRTVDRKQLEKELKGKSIVDTLIEIKEKRSEKSWDEYVQSLKVKSVKLIQNTS